MIFYSGVMIFLKIIISLTFIIRAHTGINAGGRLASWIATFVELTESQFDDLYLEPEQYAVSFGFINTYYAIYLVEKVILNLQSDREEEVKKLISILDEHPKKDLKDSETLNTQEVSGNIVGSNKLENKSPSQKQSVHNMKEQEHILHPFRDHNFIFIQFEFLDAWILDYQFNGKPIAPFLSELKRHSLYFKNFFSLIGVGGSSDPERVTLTGLFPPRLSTYMNIKEDYFSLVDALNEKGYQTASFHSDTATSYNRHQLHKNLGIQKMHFGNESFHGEGVGTMYTFDKPYYQQAIEKYMIKLQKPFFSYIITMQHHSPFTTYRPETEDYFLSSQKEKTSFNRKDQNFIRLISSLYESDQALKFFFTELSKQGLLDNTFVFIYGDHPSYNMRSQCLGKCVPLIIYHKDLPDGIPSDLSKVSSKSLPLFQVPKNPQNLRWLRDLNFKKGVYLRASSHLDIPSTVAYILGIEEGKSWLGSSLIARVEYNLTRSKRLPIE